MNFERILWIALLIIAAGVVAKGQNPTLVYTTNGMTLFPTNIHGPGKVTIGIDTNSAFWKANAGGTNGITKTFLTNVLVGVYVEQASAAWVDILSKTNYWNAKLDAAATNGFVFSSITNGLVGASITNSLASTQWVNSVVGAIDLTSRVAVSNGFGTNTTLLFPRTSGLTNTLGFFLGGPGTIGTNGSVSALTINMTQTNVGPVVMQSSLTQNLPTGTTTNTLGVGGGTNFWNLVSASVDANGHGANTGLGMLNFYKGATYIGGIGYRDNSLAGLEIRSPQVTLELGNGGGGGQKWQFITGAGGSYSYLTGQGGVGVTVDGEGKGANFTVLQSVSTTRVNSVQFFSGNTGTSPSNVMTFALGDARYLAVSGTSNSMVWSSLPYNGSWQTQAMALVGVTANTSNLCVSTVPLDFGAVYTATYLSPNVVTVCRTATSTLNGYTGAVSVASGTPLVASGGLLPTINATVSNLVNNGTLQQVGVATFNSTITAANANGTAASSIANVGTLDARHRRRVVINYGGGGALWGNSIVTSSNYFSAPSFSGGYAAYLPPGYTKFIGYTVTFQRTGSGNAILAGTFSASPTLVSAYNISQNANTTRLSGSIVATSGAVIWTNNAATFTFPALGTTNSSLTTNITVNVSLKGNVSADGLESWTNGFGFLRIAFSNYGTLPVSNLWFGGTATFEEED